MHDRKHDIDIDQGQTFEETVLYRDSSGNAVDLTGYTAKMQIRSAFGVGDADVDISTTPNDDGSITIDAEAGKLTLLIKAAKTAELEAEYIGVYDLVITAADTITKYRLLEGKATVVPGVTE